MTATCPSCRTTYRVPAPYRHRQRPTFECAACGHVFEPEPSEADWDDDDRFVMDDESGEAAGTPPRAARGRANTADDEDLTFPGEDEDGAPDAEDGEEEEEDDDADQDRRSRRPAQRGSRRTRATAASTSPARFAVRSLLAVVIFYGIVGVYVTTFPESSRAAMEHIPLVGPHLARTPIGVGHIQLAGVRASVQPLAGAADGAHALVVEATVTNHAPATAERIDLAVHLVGDDPRTERRSCTGTVLNVSSFKRGELELMAGFNDSRIVRVAPRESVTCQAIFLSYPTGLESVRVRVVAAQGR